MVQVNFFNHRIWVHSVSSHLLSQPSSCWNTPVCPVPYVSPLFWELRAGWEHLPWVKGRSPGPPGSGEIAVGLMPKPALSRSLVSSLVTVFPRRNTACGLHLRNPLLILALELRGHGDLDFVVHFDIQMSEFGSIDGSPQPCWSNNDFIEAGCYQLPTHHCCSSYWN